MEFLENAWHMVGWTGELNVKALFHCKVANEPILVCCLKDGIPAAIADRCAHRFASLHLGEQVGDLIQSGHHGLCPGAVGQSALPVYELLTGPSRSIGLCTASINVRKRSRPSKPRR
jgi:phenylpropionate dioxygenase-like ring-hydroxylating dioxygenase large terminal subunit